MTKTADIGSKRLIGLAPEAWARWVTGDPTVEVLDIPSGEFQSVSRSTDVLIKARSPGDGMFLIVNEIQFRPDKRMPLRLRVYAALAEERYGLSVYPPCGDAVPKRFGPEVSPSTGRWSSACSSIRWVCGGRKEGVDAVDSCRLQTGVDVHATRRASIGMGGTV